MTRRGHGWYGAAVITGLALAFPTAAPAAAAVDDSLGQVIGQVNSQIQGLTRQPPSVLPTPPSHPGKAPPSRPAPTTSAPAPAPARGGPVDRAVPRPAYLGRSPRASSSDLRESARGTTASKGSAHRSAASSDPTDAVPGADIRPASQVVSASKHEDGALPFTGWEPLRLVVLGLVSLGLGLGLLRAVRRRGLRGLREPQT
jgi:hypothetical protein